MMNPADSVYALVFIAAALAALWIRPALHPRRWRRTR